MLECPTRERVREYVAKNPDATFREIMAGCGLKSTSQVSHHLKALRYEKATDKSLKTENAKLRTHIAELEGKLERARAALR